MRNRGKKKSDAELRSRYRQVYVGKNHPLWPMARHGMIRLHRFVVANYLGRPLLRSEIVHHKNDNKLDNRIENLELVSNAIHNGKKGYAYQVAQLRKENEALLTEVHSLRKERGGLMIT